MVDGVHLEQQPEEQHQKKKMTQGWVVNGESPR
jgi:hypothetical protein